MKFKDKSMIVDTLIELAKESKLNTDQRKRILDIVENLEKATETQKERFILYYGLSENKKERKKLIEIAKIYGTTTSDIIHSIISVRNKLSRLHEGFEVIEQVVNECVNN